MRALGRRRWGKVLLLVVVGGLVLVSAGVASPSASTVVSGRAEYLCFGREATIVGTADADTLQGTPGDDVIVGLGGADVIYGLGGNDRICGGGGNDDLRPGPGNDRVQGGAGADLIQGSDGNDLLKGGGGADRIYGNAGDDRLVGQRGDDHLDGGPGSDTVRGGPGTDTCFGETKATCELPTVARVTFGNGTWTVPGDVPAGRYRSTSSDHCYWERLSGFGGTFDEIIANDFLDTGETAIVDIAPADRGFKSSRCGTWSNDLTPRRANPSANWVSDGFLLVGSEIAVGTWRNSGMGDHCYWERLSGFSGNIDDIITNDFTDSPSVVTIAASDVGFYADPDCGTWSKTG